MHFELKYCDRIEVMVFSKELFAYTGCTQNQFKMQT